MSLRRVPKNRSELPSSANFRSGSQEAYLRLLTAASGVSHQVDQLLRSFGITQPQFNVLRILAGADPDGLGRNDIAKRMIDSSPDMTRLLNRMMEKKWLVRRRGMEDKREVPTTLTASGRRLLKQIDAPLLELHSDQFCDVSLPELNQFLKVIKKIRAVE